MNDKIEDTGEKEEIDDIGDEIRDLGDKVKDFIERESGFKKLYEEGLDNQSMVDLSGLREYKNDNPTPSKQEPLNIWTNMLIERFITFFLDQENEQLKHYYSFGNQGFLFFMELSSTIWMLPCF